MSTSQSKRGTVCPHGVRWPWQCDECDAENPMPADYDPLAVDNDQVAFRMEAGA